MKPISLESMIGRFRRLETTVVRNGEDIKAFFDGCFDDYISKHGHSERVLTYRLGLIEKAAQPGADDAVLDIGCGIGHYLIAMAKSIGRGVGIDFSDHMVEAASERANESPWGAKLSFRIDDAEELRTISDSSVDVAMCIGALEHMPKKDRVLSSAHRVLKQGGRLVLMTPNGGYVWYRFIAPVLELDTKHLSTDTFLEGRAISRLLHRAGFRDVSIGWWTFIPRGDMHPVLNTILQVLDRAGRFFRIPSLRGGLIVTACRP